MANYRIICTNQVPVTEPTTHAHIVAVGTGVEPTTYQRKWTLDQVLAAMAAGNVFYTQGATSGKVAHVTPYVCGRCRRTYIRSTPDAIHDNNLDALPNCA